MADKIREGVVTTAAAATAESPAQHASKPQANRAQQKAITQGLRKFFDSVASEPVPEEFLALLRKIDGKMDAGA